MRSQSHSIGKRALPSGMVCIRRAVSLRPRHARLLDRTMLVRDMGLSELLATMIDQGLQAGLEVLGAAHSAAGPARSQTRTAAPPRSIPRIAHDTASAATRGSGAG